MSNWLVLVLALLAVAVPAAAKYPDDLPPAEKALADTVDPWGLPFSDSLRHFDERFTARPEAAFAVGVTHDLVKIWPSKYWFRGASSPSHPLGQTPDPLRAPSLIACAGETQSFQIAVLPRMGAAPGDYTVEVTLQSAPSATAGLFREYFVKTPAPGYPRYPVDRWPDPLVPVASGQALPVSGTDCLPLWVDIALPPDMPATTVSVVVRVTDAREAATVTVPIRVVPGLRLQPKAFPLVAWFGQKYGTHTLTDTQVRDMAAMALAHHMQPMDLLKSHFKPANPDEFDSLHRFLAEHGQNVFELEAPGKQYDYKLLYDHVKKAGWLGQALVYSNDDEPLEDTFVSSNVPYLRDMHAKYPGLRVFLASAGHPQMARGCDIWMTDLSTVGYEPERFRTQEAREPRTPILWNYYCHLPVHIQFRAPLTQAPNMEIDNEALQQRLALWMSNYYGAKGVFIWAGFEEAFADDFWTRLELSDKPGGYPYGGLHNGNNFLVYPPQTEGGPLLPSLRLKVLRAGVQDLALLRQAQELLDQGKIVGARARRLRELLNPVPGLFVHPQYWDRLPETLLARRDAILEELARR